MKNSKQKNQVAVVKKLLFICLSFVSFATFLVYFGGSFFFLELNDIRNRSLISSRRNYVNSNNDKLMYVYTDVFPKTKECNEKNVLSSSMKCELDARKMIDNNLSVVLGNEGGQIGRRPIFFIRLKDKQTIEKLYQGGGYRQEPVDTKGEKMVVQMLLGKRDPFAYPQYNCCGGDDFVPDIPFFNLFLPTRSYLKDFYSETEQIYLMRNKEDEIIGALVYLYGD